MWIWNFFTAYLGYVQQLILELLYFIMTLIGYSLKEIRVRILKYSTLHARPTLHSNIHSMNSLIYRDELSIEGWRALHSLVIYGFCSNKTLYSASPSFPMFIGSAAPARRVLQNRIWPSFPLSRCFLTIGSLFFSKFWRGARNPNDVVRKRTNFFKKKLLCPKHCENGSNLGQEWNFFELNFLNYLIFTEFVL